jgi:AraC family transcriptional regulator
MQLGSGQFFGISNARRAVAGMTISRLQPTIPAEQLELHTHEDAHLVFVRAGQYLSSAHGAPEVCDSGHLIYNPPGTRHRDRFRELKGASFLTVSLQAEKVTALVEELRLPSHSLCLPSGCVYAHLLKLDVELSRWNELSPMIVEAECMELLIGIGSRKSTPHRAPPKWLKGICGQLENRTTQTIGEIAHSAGVHPVHLARTFREFYRCSPGEYARQCRLSYAAKLLSRTKLPLATIAVDTGYVDQSHLSNEFRRRAGISPKEFRRLSNSDSR